MIDERFDKFKNRELTEIKVVTLADNVNEVFVEDFYPYHVGDSDTMIVTDEQLYQLLVYKRIDNNKKRNKKRQPLNISYDNEDFIGMLGAYSSGVDEQVIARSIIEEAFENVSELTYKRAYMHFVLGYKPAAIARMEGVNASSITRSLDEFREEIYIAHEKCN